MHLHDSETESDPTTGRKPGALGAKERIHDETLSATDTYKAKLSDLILLIRSKIFIFLFPRGSVAIRRVPVELVSNPRMTSPSPWWSTRARHER